jgi:hypothetical protein
MVNHNVMHFFGEDTDPWTCVQCFTVSTCCWSKNWVKSFHREKCSRTKQVTPSHAKSRENCLLLANKLNYTSYPCICRPFRRFVCTKQLLNDFWLFCIAEVLSWSPIHGNRSSRSVPVSSHGTFLRNGMEADLSLLCVCVCVCVCVCQWLMRENKCVCVMCASVRNVCICDEFEFVCVSACGCSIPPFQLSN